MGLGLLGMCNKRSNAKRVPSRNRLRQYATQSFIRPSLKAKIR
jgi:hypothetical protein